MVMKKDHPHGRISATTVTLLFLTIPFLVTFFFFLLLSPYKYVTSIPHLIQIFEASFIGFISLVGIRFHHQNPVMKDMKKIIPQLHVKASGRVDKLERFSNYVVRQMGFENIDESYQIGKLAQDYLRNPKVCDDKILDLFTHNPQRESLYAKLIEEFDKCILSYFAFHWTHATLMITQVLSVDSEPERKLKNIVMAATRKQRFERITKDLKVVRVFKTLVEEMKAIGIPAKDESHCTEIMVPAAHSQRSPVLLLMGGGMGAGKSTVLKDILQVQDAFWSEASSNAVIVEADAFKETDVIYRALSSRGHHHDMLQTAELVHQSSTDAASSLLVTALNEGRDVIMDGTLAWEPFVQQTIAMARKVHQYRYRMGVGYKVSEDGNIIENYWEQVNNEEEDNIGKRKPYRVELVGVVCDAYLAVVRGIRRAITIKRAVRVKSQLTSHKRFAQAFPRYCQLVDNARLYCTNAMGGPPKLIGWKEGDNNLLVDRSQIECLDMVSTLNEDADSIYQVYGHHQDPTRDMGSFWREIVWSPTRKSLQHQLKIAIINNRDGQPNLL